MPSIAKRCHELRIVDERMSWRIVYRLDHDAVVILAVFRKATPKTPARIIEDIRRRLRQYDALSREK
jgi:phage-related protein